MLGCVVSGDVRYLGDEHQDKLQRPMEKEGWVLDEPAKGIPRQRNGYDCGVFLCMFADYLVGDKVRARIAVVLSLQHLSSQAVVQSLFALVSALRRAWRFASPDGR